MIILKPTVQRLIQDKGIKGMQEFVMKAAFTCYQTLKSKFTAEEFIYNVLIKQAHTRPLEFGTVFMKVPLNRLDGVFNILHSQYTRVKFDEQYAYITTNYRVIIQGAYKTDFEASQHNYNRSYVSAMEEFWCDKTDMHEDRYTFDCIMSRGCTDDFRTHVTLSSICESTRYCTYNKDKFGNQMTFIDPYFLDGYEKFVEKYGDKMVTELDILNSDDKNFVMYNALMHMEMYYKHYMSLDKTCAQEGKRIIPLGVKAQLLLCGYKDAWDNFIWRRCDDHADPECKIIADEIKKML